ncbi:MAG: ABC transporter ATP-binding protein [Bacteroidales bacterium]
MVTDPIIRFKEVWKGYGDQTVLQNLSLDINKGEFLTIIGGSGSGKTTLLKLVNGLLFPDRGEIEVEGVKICQTNLIHLRRRIGYAIQNIGLFPHLTIRKNIAYVLSLYSKQPKQINEQVERLMRMLELDEKLLDRYPAELSGGQKQRVGIARALAAEPPILLMDEPFGAVDEITRQVLQDEIAQLQRTLGTTILFVTHDIKEALKLGSKMLIMKDGHIEQFDTPNNIMHNPASDYVKSLLQFTHIDRR